MRRLAVSVPCFEIGEILSEVCNETALPLVVRSKNVIDCLGLYSAASVHCSAIPVPKVGDLQSNPHRREYTSDRYCRDAVVRESPPHESSGQNECYCRGLGLRISSIVPSHDNSPFRSLEQGDTVEYDRITFNSMLGLRA